MVAQAYDLRVWEAEAGELQMEIYSGRAKGVPQYEGFSWIVSITENKYKSNNN